MKPQKYNTVYHHYITIISPIGFIVELITESLNSVPVGLLIQRVRSLVCLREKTHSSNLLYSLSLKLQHAKEF